jgi:integrase
VPKVPAHDAVGGSSPGYDEHRLVGALQHRPGLLAHPGTARPALLTAPDHDEIGRPGALLLQPRARHVPCRRTVLNTVRGALRAWTVKQRPGPKASSDMAGIIDLMLATGARIGEVLALRWADVALQAARPNLTINGTIKTESGKGTYRKASPKSDSSVRTVVLPEFAIAVLRRRQAAARENPNNAVFPTRNGTWQQVNNVERRWRQIRKDTGLEWVTPHTFRNGGDPDRGAGRRRDRLAAAWPLLPRHHPGVLHLQAGHRG